MGSRDWNPGVMLAGGVMAGMSLAFLTKDDALDAARGMASLGDGYCRM